MSDSPRVSIIIPIFNVGPFLRACLDSLLAQTRQDFIGILVDDGSTDDSGRTAKEYAERYPDRFRFLHQDNRGQGAARNNGLQYVDTPYVLFLDSDDFYGPRVLERIFDKVDEVGEEIDCALFDFEIYDMPSLTFRPFHDVAYVKKAFEGKTITNAEETPLFNRFEMSLCRMLWSAEFLKKNHFAFPEGIKWEDVPARFYLLRRAKKCIYIGDVGAFYRIHGTSQTTSGHGRTRLDVIKAFGLVVDASKKENWTPIERGYLLFWLETFSYWSVQVVENQYLPELVEGLRPLFLDFNKEERKLYAKVGEPHFRDRAFLYFIRSKRRYKTLFDRGAFKRYTTIYHKVRRLLGK